ncbi:hypothetical protein E4U58_003448 [Claviceps cyperi]|nr:hypothetical protein E4U58_003448 [Claviceps cyperi]
MALGGVSGHAHCSTITISAGVHGPRSRVDSVVRKSNDVDMPHVMINAVDQAHLTIHQHDDNPREKNPPSKRTCYIYDLSTEQPDLEGSLQNLSLNLGLYDPRFNQGPRKEPRIGPDTEDLHP